MTPSNRRFAILATASLGTIAPAAASADDTIKRPGDHPHYSVELEPHVLIGWASNYYYGSDDGFGVGARVSINLTHDGFIEKINNSVAIGLGLDWVHYSGPNCYYYGRGPGCFAGVSADFFQFPIVMQWNFYVARRWSVFGEPGLTSGTELTETAPATPRRATSCHARSRAPASDRRSGSAADTASTIPWP